MGNRLVQKISCNGNFYAASYQHWSAGDAQIMEDLTDKKIEEYDFFNHPSKELAYKILKEALDEYNENSLAGLVLEFYISSKKDGKHLEELYNCPEGNAFYKKHPETTLSTSRTEGLITLDEVVANDWYGWAEDVNDFYMD